jgi:hypothetical protein
MARTKAAAKQTDELEDHRSKGEKSKDLSPSKAPKIDEHSSPSSLVKSISLTNSDGRLKAQKKLDLDCNMADCVE